MDDPPEHPTMFDLNTVNDVRELFESMWHQGYDGKDLAIAFVKVAADVVRNENPEDINELRKLLD